MNNPVKPQTKLRTDLLDSDGENRAVRAFLSMYSNDRTITVGNMASSLQAMGWSSYPDWVEENPNGLLTKAGAQSWLRHLFSLEPASGNADMCWVEGGEEEPWGMTALDAVGIHIDYSGYEPMEGDRLIIKRAKRLNDLEIRVSIDLETGELGYEAVY